MACRVLAKSRNLAPEKVSLQMDARRDTAGLLLG